MAPFYVVGAAHQPAAKLTPNAQVVSATEVARVGKVSLSGVSVVAAMVTSFRFELAKCRAIKIKKAIGAITAA